MLLLLTYPKWRVIGRDNTCVFGRMRLFGEFVLVEFYIIRISFKKHGPFSWYTARLQLIKFTIGNDNRKEEGRVRTILLHVIIKSPKPSENRLTAIMN